MDAVIPIERSLKRTAYRNFLAAGGHLAGRPDRIEITMSLREAQADITKM